MAAAVALALAGCAYGDAASAGPEPQEAERGSVVLGASNERGGPRPSASSRRADVEIIAAEGVPSPAVAHARATCRVGAFCEDFERGVLDVPLVAVAEPRQESVAIVASPGGPSGRVLTAKTARAGDRAYVVMPAGSSRAAWAGGFALSYWLDRLPLVAVVGPTLIARRDGEIVATVGFEVRGGALFVTQRTLRGGRVASTARSEVLARVEPARWYPLTLGLELTADGRGRVEASADSASLTFMPLRAPMASADLELAVGITDADAEPAGAYVDDLMFVQH